ncbi:MAG: hypothetical protein WAM60_19090 [Candidatus Promineifilaceae bacterium]
MKKVVLLSWLVLILAACSGGNSSEPTAEVQPTDPVVSSAVSDIQIAVASNDFATGAPRIPFILFDGPDEVADAQSVQVSAFDLAQETRQVGWSGAAMNYSDYEVPYWVVYPEVETAGNWGLLAKVTLADGSVVQAPFTVQISDQTEAPAIGSPAPPSNNRTLATEPDIAKLTSGTDPEPGLYQMTVADALKSGRPTVVTLATPAFCQTRICAPVVKSVEAVYDEYNEQANFIHLEIYKDFQTLETADEVAEWGLPSEPWTFVVNSDGIITARLGGPVSPRELTEALTAILP